MRSDALPSQKAEISSRLDALTIAKVRNKDEDKYEALDKLTKIVNHLASMARPKERDDEAKVRFLTKAVEGTECGLNFQQRI